MTVKSMRSCVKINIAYKESSPVAYKTNPCSESRSNFSLLLLMLQNVFLNDFENYKSTLVIFEHMLCFLPTAVVL